MTNLTRSNSRVSTNRRGMTLFELLLVLALLVVVGSMAAPLLDGAFASVRLRRGADQVLAAWNEIRIQAIQTGTTHQFQFQRETGHFRVQPWQALPADETLADPNAAAAVTSQDSTQVEWEPYESELPEEIAFAEGDRLTVDETSERVVATLDQGSESEWSAPILFFPDGSSSSASLLLRNERHMVQRVTLRGLTGVARVSEILTLDEVRQLKAR